MPAETKVILFDVGGVYLHGSFRDFIARASALLGIKSVSTGSGVAFDAALNKGEVPLSECLKKFFGVPISPEQMGRLTGLWTTTWKPLDEMMELVLQLKKHYRLGIISNSDAVNSANYSRKGWYDHFELVILSHEIGILKPDLGLYELALEKLKAKPEECVFIDDQEECLKPAKQLGMRTVLFKSVPQLRQELKALGIIVS